MYIAAHNIISPLGWTSEENFQQVVSDKSGIKLCSNRNISDSDFQASLIDEGVLKQKLAEHSGLENYTKLEQLSILSIKSIIKSVDVKSKRTGFIFSTTKGNIDQLHKHTNPSDVLLASCAQKIADYFGFTSKAQVVSNACISGLAAFIVAKRYIDAGLYENVVILGADVLSKFIVSGFQSFQSLSAEPCKPFDTNRNGLTLGEGVASLVLSRATNETSSQTIELVNGAIRNDANHISGPSRTGEGLFRAIQATLKDFKSIDAICAHGTATPFNDDMESQAIYRSGLATVPVFGLKGYFGHTLGAAGIIESIISILAMQKNIVIGTKGLLEQGVVSDINVVKENETKEITEFLKLMSGFGGCNAAIYFKKHG